MRRLSQFAILAGLFGLGLCGAASADETPRAPATTTVEPAHVIAGQAHLVFRSNSREDEVEGQVTVVERRSGVTVVEELSSSCDEACGRRRLAWADTPEPPVRE